MIYIMRGDFDLGRAIESGGLEVIGVAKARRALRAWLNVSPLPASDRNGRMPKQPDPDGRGSG